MASSRCTRPRFPVPIALASSWDPVARRARDERRRVRSARPRLATRARASRRSRPRSALGTIRGNLRRGSVPRRPLGRRGRPRLPGRQHCRSAATTSSRRSNTSPATDRTKAASTPRRASCPSGCCARSCSRRSKPRSRKPARSPSCRATTRSTACRRTRIAGCSRTCCGASGDSRALVVSDYFGIEQLVSRQHVARRSRRRRGPVARRRRGHRAARRQRVPAAPGIDQGRPRADGADRPRGVARCST